ncbi:MAG: glycosyltransferase family 4 protein [Lachnospiraceae bacterium]
MRMLRKGRRTEIKIVFITHYDNMYGANRAMYHLMVRLKKEYGEEPVVIIPAEGEMTRCLAEEGIRYYVHPVTQWQAVYSDPVRFFIKKMIRKRNISRELISLTELCKAEQPDCIYSNSSVIGTGAMLAEKLGCRHIWHIREFSKEHFHMRYFYPRKRVCRLYEQTDCLVTISDALKKNYMKKYPKAKIVRIYDGVSIAAADRENFSGKRPIRFCYVGYLFPMKHQEQVLEACKLLNEAGFTNYELYLVGGGKEEYQRLLRTKIETEQLPQVKLTGYVDDVHTLLNTMDIGIIASEYEGFGLVTVEYMLHGMPVIGRNSGGTPEIILDAVTGYLYDETEELYQAMKQLMQSPDQVRKMGDAGRKRAKECFTEEKNAQAVAELIREVQKGEITCLS